jgi:AAA domain
MSTASPFAKPKPKAAPPPSSGRGLLAMLISQPGLGKSSLLAQFPHVHFIVDSRDQGILDLIDYRQATKVKLTADDVEVVSSYEELEEALKAAIVNPDYWTIVCESLVGIQAFCTQRCLEVDYQLAENPGKARNNFINYRNGHDLAANSHFQLILDLLIAGQNRGKGMWMTGHSKVGTAKSITVSSDDFVADLIEATPEMARRVNATFANIFHIGTSAVTNKSFSMPKAKATGDVTRCIYCTNNPHFPAKNRMGLFNDIDYPEDVELAYQVLCNAMSLDPATGRRK